MSCEPKRGCGHRKQYGLYLVSPPGGYSCDRLPIPLCVCPVCGEGVRQARGWRWVDVDKLVEGIHFLPFDQGTTECPCAGCLLCENPQAIHKAGLLWIGHQFYKTPDEFMAEGRALGFSKRIKFVPRKFEVGKTWVVLAHPKAVREFVDVPVDPADPTLLAVQEVKFTPGIFTLWRPTRIEMILPDTEKENSELIENLGKRGISPFFVPADDPDHQGSVFDSKSKKEEELFV